MKLALICNYFISFDFFEKKNAVLKKTQYGQNTFLLAPGAFETYIENHDLNLRWLDIVFANYITTKKILIYGNWLSYNAIIGGGEGLILNRLRKFMRIGRRAGTRY